MEGSKQTRYSLAGPRARPRGTAVVLITHAAFGGLYLHAGWRGHGSRCLAVVSRVHCFSAANNRCFGGLARMGAAASVDGRSADDSFLRSFQNPSLPEILDPSPESLGEDKPEWMSK